MYSHLAILPRLLLPGTIAVSAVTAPFTAGAQEVTVGAPVVIILGQQSVRATDSIDRDDLMDKQSIAGLWGKFQSEGSLNSASLGFLTFDYSNAGSSSVKSAPPSPPVFWDQTNDAHPFGEYVRSFAIPDDSPKTVGAPNGSAALVNGLLPRFEDAVSGGPTVRNALWIGFNNNTEWLQGGSNFELGMSAQFVCRRNTRLPVTVQFPAYFAVGDEEYFYGPHYGYITAGVNFRVPVTFISRRYGIWSAGSSADFCYYGATTREFAKSIGLQIPRLAVALSAAF